MSTYGALILKLSIYCTPTAARFGSKLFLTPPVRHDLPGNCFSRHRCGAHCGTICPETVSHATLCGAPNPTKLLSRHEHLRCFDFEIEYLLHAHCGTIRPKTVSHATGAAPIAARFARKLFLTPPLRRLLRHDLPGTCFPRHPLRRPPPSKISLSP